MAVASDCWRLPHFYSPRISRRRKRVLTPQTPIRPKGAILQTEFPKAGKSLLLAGFPLGENNLILQVGVATGFWTSPPRSQTTPPASTLRLMLSVVSNPGISGGPVFDEDGKVVGLLEGNLTSPVTSDQLATPSVSLRRTCWQ